MEFSNYQMDIFSDVDINNNNIIIEAVAGSGKTITLVEIMNRISGDIIFLAFNKSIAKELKTKTPDHVNCSTLHSCGLSILRNTFNNVTVDNRKIDILMDSYNPLKIDPSMKWKVKLNIIEIRSYIKTVIALIKNCGIDYNNLKLIQDILTHYNIIYDERCMSFVKYIMDKNNITTNIIDFDDMIYLPKILNTPVPQQYDYILVDEVQDLNGSQIDLVMSLIKEKTGRVICVGDSKQSIYGFRGADTEAMQKLKQLLNGKSMPLSVCYRCPTSHIELAKKIVPQIEAKPDAHEGIIEYIDTDEFVDNIILETNPLILCRVNAHLVKYALKLFAKGHRAIVKGKDIGRSLITVVKKNKSWSGDINEFLINLNKWYNKEKKHMVAKEASISTIENLKDRYDTINIISMECNKVQDIIDKLENIFSDEENPNAYIFSTVHKAKGLEADSTYILSPELLPLNRKGMTEWEIEQEMNIKYVALTRAKNKLVFVG